ncbi:MAG TPA: MraY family glycosyltransferase [Candidatus Sulfotelmatobacter sp.]|nr:MraY family glycosyltransferase [Candidatus Sulfotelmatobacter sp.]
MPYSLQLALATLALTVVATALVRVLAHRAGALDHPGPRRIHDQPVPTLGGLAMAASTLAVAWLARTLPGPARELDVRPLLGLSLASVPLLGLGIVDDTRGVSPPVKLLFQIAAGVVLVAFGYGVPLLTNPFGEPIAAGIWSGPLAILWVVIVINAINLIDGLDGLAAGVVAIAAATLWWVGRGHGDFYVMFMASLLIGTTLGFLFFNFPPARIFMGDTGSHFLGLVLAAASLLENRKATTTVALLFPLTALAVPLADGVFAFARRLKAGRHVFSADREHVHHRVLRLGIGPRASLFVLWGFCGACGLLGMMLEALPRATGVLLVAAMAVALFGVYRLLGRRGDSSN